MSATATRYECSARVTAHCDRANGTPKRSTCRRCGSALRVESGRWGVFEWTGRGEYPASAALALFAREASADAFAEGHADESASVGGLVVRWVTA